MIKTQCAKFLKLLKKKNTLNGLGGHQAAVSANRLSDS